MSAVTAMVAIMVDLLIIMHDSQQFAEVSTAGLSPHRLAWLRRVRGTVGDWQVWSPADLPAARSLLETFPDVGAGSAQWRAVEWCRTHWEQLLADSGTHVTPALVARAQWASMMGVDLWDVR